MPTDKQVHARNPKWTGPLCQYDPGPYASPSGAMLSTWADNGDVTCRLCRRRLTSGPPPAEAVEASQLPTIKMAPPKPRRYPIKIKIKPDAKLVGTITVREPSPGTSVHRVSFDARTKEIPPKPVFDLSVFTSDMIFEWTGVRLET